jgi:hypothetical protein
VDFSADFMCSVWQEKSVGDQGRHHSVFAGGTAELTKVLAQERLASPYRIQYKSRILRASVEPFDYARFKFASFIIAPETRRAITVAPSCDQM